MIGMMRALTLAGTLLLLCGTGAAVAAEPGAALDAPVPYTVQPRDTLIGIGRQILAQPSDYKAVQALNRVARPRRLRVGAVLSVPYDLLRFVPLGATLVAFRGTVTVTSGGAAVPTVRDMKLAEGYALATGPDAFLTIEFEDGSRTTLPSRSRLTIRRLRKVSMTGAVDRVLALDTGRSDSSVQHLTGPKDRFVVTTPLAVAAVRGTQFRVAFDEETAHSLLEVIEGRVGSTAGDDQAETLAPAGFGLVTAKGAAARLVPLLGAPKVENPGKIQDAAETVFTVGAVPDAKSYRAQLASDGGFVDLIAERGSQTPVLSFGAVPDGDYFVRVSAIDENGLEGRSATYAVQRELNTFDPQKPAPAAGGGRRYRFRWSTAGAGVKTFRFQMATAPDATPIVDEPGLTDNEIVVTDLPPGTYFWRVLVTSTQKGRQTERWTAPERFELAN